MLGWGVVDIGLGYGHFCLFNMYSLMFNLGDFIKFL